jgi:hypothetical protein
MPLYYDQSTLGSNALSGAAGATSIGFYGPGQTGTIDANSVLQVLVSGGAALWSGSTNLGYAREIKFDGSAVAAGSLTNGTGTITVNAGAGGSVDVSVTGTLLGAATAINFVGSGATASFAGGTAHVTISAGGVGPGGITTYTTGIWVLSGRSGTREGSFDICHSTLTTGSRVFVFQSAEPPTGKGGRPDEAQMDLIVFKAQKVNPALTCTVHWVAASPVSGVFNLDWFMG